MKKVVDIPSLSIIEVPDDYIECSICRKWLPPEEFRDEGSEQQNRTNCVTCYHQAVEKWDEIYKPIQEMERKNANAIRKLKEELSILEAAITKDEFKNRLLKELDKIPDDALLFGHHDGYESFNYDPDLVIEHIYKKFYLVSI